MLGPIDLRRFLTPTGVHCRDVCPNTRYVLKNEVETVLNHGEFEPLCPHCGEPANWTGYDSGIDWVIVGGESGRDARSMHPSWPRSIRDQCCVAAVPFLFKQWGQWSEFVNEDHYTHCGEERHAHAWVDAQTAQHGLCWLVDDDGVWSNHTGEPPTDENGQITDDIAVMGWLGKAAAGRELDDRQYDGLPESPSAQPGRLTPMPA